MGLTKARVRLYGPDPSRPREVELLVDTGSTFTWVDAGLLREMGVAPTARKPFRTIDGRALERETGEAVLEFDGSRATRIIVFARDGDAQVLGVDALEGLGLEVDPVARKLRKVEAFYAV